MSTPKQKENTPQNPAFLARLKSLIGAEPPYGWAKRMEISKGAFTRIYKKGTVPTVKLLERIRRGTGVSLDWLLRGEGAMYSDRVAEEAGPYKVEMGVGVLSGEETREWLNMIGKLSPEQRAHFRALMDEVVKSLSLKRRSKAG